MINSTIVRLTAQELGARLAASKGGNTPGITEDHRYEMAQRLKALAVREQEREAARDQVIAEMTAFERSDLRAENTSNAIIALTIIAAIAITAWAIGIF